MRRRRYGARRQLGERCRRKAGARRALHWETTALWRRMSLEGMRNIDANEPVTNISSSGGRLRPLAGTPADRIPNGKRRRGRRGAAGRVRAGWQHANAYAPYPALRPPGARSANITQQVHGQPAGAARLFLRDAARSFARHISQLLLSTSALAVHRQLHHDYAAGNSTPASMVAQNGICARRRRGIVRRSKIPCRFFYGARGSQLFEKITRILSDAHWTGILRAMPPRLLKSLSQGATLVEFSSGSSVKTTASYGDGPLRALSAGRRVGQRAPGKPPRCAPPFPISSWRRSSLISPGELEATGRSPGQRSRRPSFPRPSATSNLTRPAALRQNGAPARTLRAPRPSASTCRGSQAPTRRRL